MPWMWITDAFWPIFVIGCVLLQRRTNRKEGVTWKEYQMLHTDDYDPNAGELAQVGFLMFFLWTALIVFA